MKARPQGRRWRAALLSALVLCSLRGLSASAMGNPNERYAFDIPQGVAAWRLNDFGTQSGMQLLFNFEDMKGVNVAAVHGEFKPFDALNAMIAGTDIRYEYVNRRTVTLTRTTVAKRPGKVLQEMAVASQPAADDRRTSGTALAEVTVISRYESPIAGTGSPILSVPRTDIDATGFVTAQGVVRTLPQIFGGGPTEDTNAIGAEARTNIARGSGINLRGLGASSTLVLMNGRRLPGGGSEGVFVDISNLPLDAVERIDILPDSSSTFYGSDAAAGVVNFVMRNKFAGRQTEAYFGGSTRGALGERYISQIVGGQSTSGHGLLAMDFYSRDDLAASSRRQAKSNLSEFGGSDFDISQSNPGNILVGGVPYAVPAGQDGTSLQPSGFVRGTPNLQNQWEGADVLPSQQRWSVFGTWQQDLTSSLSWFNDVLVGERIARGQSGGFPMQFVVPTTNAFYVAPPGVSGPLVMRYNFIDDLGPQIAEAHVKSGSVTSGLQLEFGRGWKALLSGTYSTERVDSTIQNQVSARDLADALSSSDRGTAFNPFGDGSHTNPTTLDSLHGHTDLSYRSSIASGGLLLNGPVASLPAGEVLLSLGTEGREQAFESELFANTTSTPTLQYTDTKRTIYSGFAELKVPVFGIGNRLPGLEALTLSVAERYEHYDDFGPNRANRLGLSWAPVTGWTLRGSYSESFRPPGLMDLDESTNAYQFTTLRDPQSPTGTSQVLLWAGKNRNLHAESARSWTAGFELESPERPDSVLALTYFHTNFDNRLNRPTPTANVLSDPTLQSLVTRNPSAVYQEEVCTRSPQTSVPDCLTRPIAAIIDGRLRNDAVTRTRGIDLLGRHEVRTGFGNFSFSLNGTYVLEFDEATAPNLPLVDKVSTQNYPINFRARGSVRWQRGSFDVSSFVTFANNYRDTTSIPERHVDSWTTFDLHAAYTVTSMEQAWWGDTTFSLGVDNLLDKDPPFLNNSLGVGYDQENGDLTGRMWSITVRKKW